MRSRDQVPGPFREPGGLLFCRDGRVYRQINWGYAEFYEQQACCILLRTVQLAHHRVYPQA